MRMLTRLVVGVATAAAAATMAVTPALADPNPGTVPKPQNIVGVGSDTTEFILDQLSHDYNASHSANKVYSWDALNPKTGAQHDSIVTKSGCAAIPRPDGSSEGITALTTENAKTGTHPCMDFARSSRDRTPSDPPYASGGIAFVDLAGDAETWATNPTTNAPSNLSFTQLVNIYECKVTNWDQVGGKNAPIHAFIPQTGSGTRAFWLTALGNGTAITPGSCVSDVSGTLEENEGVNPALAGPDTIVALLDRQVDRRGGPLRQVLQQGLHVQLERQGLLPQVEPEPVRLRHARRDGAGEDQRQGPDHRDGDQPEDQRRLRSPVHPDAVRRGAVHHLDS